MPFPFTKKSPKDNKEVRAIPHFILIDLGVDVALEKNPNPQEQMSQTSRSVVVRLDRMLISTCCPCRPQYLINEQHQARVTSACFGIMRST